MIHSHTSNPRDLDLEADVCVVGSGAGGSIVARELAEAGLRVVLLEEGGYYTAKDFDQVEAHMVPKLFKERGNQASTDLSISVLQGRCVGGSTVVHYLCCFRTPDRVLREWAERGVVGLSAAELKPCLDEVWDTLSVSKMPPSMLNRNNELLKIGADKLGWSGDTFHRNQIGCWGSGFCHEGCAYDAKQSALLTYVHLAVTKGAEVHAGCRVERVLVQGGRAIGVEGITLDPETDAPRGWLRVRAAVTVLSCGAINTPEVLIRSDLGGSQVGRNLYLHPVLVVSARFDEDVNPYYGVKQGYYVDQWSDVHHDEIEAGFLLEGVGSQPGLSAVASPGHGRTHRALMEGLSKSAIALVLVRDRDPGRLTVDGDGRRRIEHAWSDRDGAQGREGVARIAEAFLAAGARGAYPALYTPVEIKSTADLAAVAEIDLAPGKAVSFSAHPQGTCRMGEDPATSVVDSRGRVHGVKNLLVADASVFPTPTGVNPQITVYAVASHHARLLRDHWNEVVSGRA